MPVVFIHGVNVRKDGGYASAVQARDALFRSISLKQIASGRKLDVFNPYWGDRASTFPFGHAYIPGGAEAFGSAGPVEEAAADAAPVTGGTANNSICLLARQRSLLDAIDALWSCTSVAGISAETAALLAGSAPRAVAYALANPVPDWLSQVQTNSAFIDQLLYAVDNSPAIADEPGSATSVAPEAFGAVSSLGQVIKKAAVSLGQRLADTVTDPFAPAVKRAALLRFTRFFGDVFVYIKESGATNKAIRETVLNDLHAAAALGKQAGEKLIVVGHSMGGNIGYDLLSSSARDVHVDLFLTVGSQVGLFEELKTFAASSSAIPGVAGAKVPCPSNIGRWVNVYDPSDPFGYALSRIFDRAEDYEFDTHAGPISAHSAYFYKPGFHHRLAARLKGNA